MSDKRGVFISHIHQEQGVAAVLQKYIRRSFREQFPVFVSTDQESVGGGRKWFQHIIDDLRLTKVVLVLVSEYSRDREWINFEAGFGDGAGAAVIPISIRNFSLGTLRFPLLGYNGRTVDNIEGIISDISRETGIIGEMVDRLEYLREIEEAERKLIYRNLVLTPFLSGQYKADKIQFEIQNFGNTDADVLFIEITFPHALTSQSWSPIHRGDNVVFMIEESDHPDGKIYTVRYTSSLGGKWPRLYPVLTRSMGPRVLDMVSIPLADGYESELWQKIKYQVFAREYDTESETRCLRDMDVRLTHPRT